MRYYFSSTVGEMTPHYYSLQLYNMIKFLNHLAEFSAVQVFCFIPSELRVYVHIYVYVYVYRYYKNGHIAILPIFNVCKTST